LIAVDTSALIAIAQQEAGFAPMRLLMAQSRCMISVAVLLEAHLVLRGRGIVDPDLFLAGVRQMPTVRIADLSLPHFHAARDAFDRYGKGRGHPAQLNYGDCMSYAVAKVADVPLLYVGRDFALTDIASALNPDRLP
jgi:ribonuclease VapC